MSALLPSPDSLGLPFDRWRPGQPEAILHAIDTLQRFDGLVLPTGFGKSLVYMAIAHLTGWRTVILTSTKALQRQLDRDFGADLSTALVQGQRAYLCHALAPGGELVAQFGDLARRGPAMVDHGPCHLGVDCSLKSHGCAYFDSLRHATSRQIVLTNYAWWFAQVRQAQIPLRPDLLVLDEAHAAPDSLADALGATITPDSIATYFQQERLPRADALDAVGWVSWARQRSIILATMLTGASPRSRDAVIRIRQGQALLMGLQRIGQIDPKLLLVSEDRDGVRFDVVWAAAYAEQWLFRGTRRVILTSATMTRKTADLLGILDKELSFYEAGDGFPLHRRPVYIAPAAKPGTVYFDTDPKGVQVDHRLTPQDELAWLAHIDAIIGGRLDRKGIIHTVSYHRRDLILKRSAHAHRMITHSRTDAQHQIQTFKEAPPGTVLVSPAVTTGYDFPYTECEYQILGKIPFPDRRDPVTAARTIVDAQYPNHVAMQELVQAVGRGMRSPDDQCETFICDAHASWFLSKHADLAPRWFRRAVSKLTPGTVPTPPPSLPRSLTAGSEVTDD
jgi:Rad3-related DNA helicase